MDYSELIEIILNKFDKKYKQTDKGYNCQNPFYNDINPSAIFYSDGWLLSLSCNLIDNRNRLHIKEVCLLLGCIELYIEFMMYKNNIPSYKLNAYRELIIQDKKHKEYGKIFYDLGISKSDILGMSYMKPINPNKFIHNKPKVKKTPPKEVEQTKEEYDKCIKYMEGRKLPLLDICKPSTLLMNETFRCPCIKFTYPNGYAKFRLLEGKLRYLTSTESGEYEELFETQIIGSNKALIQEGEANSVSLIGCNLDYDIYAMNNLNSLPKTNQLMKYDEVIVIIDKDKYDNVKEGLFNNMKKLTKEGCKIRVIYAFEDEEEDFNSYLIKNNSEILKKYVDSLINL